MNDNDLTSTTDALPAADAPSTPAGPLDSNAPNASILFDDLPLSDAIKAGLRAQGYTSPTRVQSLSLPPGLEGKDLLVRARTGSGKTTAFALPVLERIDLDAPNPQAIVLAPTRELALQVSEEMAALGAIKGVTVVPVYGGVSLHQQKQQLSRNGGPHIVVATPGRLMDHMRSRNVDLGTCRFAVLDEADEMLSIGFLEDVRYILSTVPKSAQMLLFSATLEASLQKLVQDFLKDPVEIAADVDQLTVRNIDNLLCETLRTVPKPRTLLYLLMKMQPESAIIFCNTKTDVGMIAGYLARQGLNADAISGDLKQNQREAVMKGLKSHELRFLVATDVAARGIDISHLTHVFNYTLPEDPAVYLHRSGRTGRIGRRGVAVSLLSGREFATQSAIEKRFGIQFKMIELEDIPTLEAQRDDLIANLGGRPGASGRPKLVDSLDPLPPAPAPAKSAPAPAKAVPTPAAAATRPSSPTSDEAYSTLRALLLKDTPVAPAEAADVDATPVDALLAEVEPLLMDDIAGLENEADSHRALKRALALSLYLLRAQNP